MRGRTAGHIDKGGAEPEDVDRRRGVNSLLLAAWAASIFAAVASALVNALGG